MDKELSQAFEGLGVRTDQAAPTGLKRTQPPNANEQQQ